MEGSPEALKIASREGERTTRVVSRVEKILQPDAGFDEARAKYLNKPLFMLERQPRKLPHYEVEMRRRRFYANMHLAGIFSRQGSGGGEADAQDEVLRAKQITRQLLKFKGTEDITWHQVYDILNGPAHSVHHMRRYNLKYESPEAFG
ncbi:MAG: hypothetical protein MHM6MM_007623, partial [Cercozoa sp. M6MM]